ncbi:MAG: hypothetical protein U0S50_12875 [Sphingopyxis sp.]|uniref:hypothetical protein n=1 Tax=Sphingopyxis sp. TaxID=1908224 RepID=UPI002ABCD6D6|nr:hypothetical protein [Sphingopyxis sp.]MDZ3832689.1 hypothetical protein [Sphingopyxis sp.]
MKMLHLPVAALAMIATGACAASAPTAVSATPAAPATLQDRVDSSFSPLAINSRLADVKAGLQMITENDCLEMDECEWRDAEGVRHFFWSDSSDTPKLLVIKFVVASEFEGRAISALGIGNARMKADVIDRVRAFDPRMQVECDGKNVSGNVGVQECAATVGDGWVQIGFDADDRLTKIRFDGYQFI